MAIYFLKKRTLTDLSKNGISIERDLSRAIKALTSISRGM